MYLQSLSLGLVTRAKLSVSLMFEGVQRILLHALQIAVHVLHVWVRISILLAIALKLSIWTNFELFQRYLPNHTHQLHIPLNMITSNVTMDIVLLFLTYNFNMFQYLFSQSRILRGPLICKAMPI